MADESLLAQLLVEKFADHQPIYRQSEKMAREGI
jgi:transposase